MATLTNEQIEQKKQLLVEKMTQMKSIYDELVEAGAIELSDEDLDAAVGGGKVWDWITKKSKELVEAGQLTYHTAKAISAALRPE